VGSRSHLESDPTASPAAEREGNRGTSPHESRERTIVKKIMQALAVAIALTATLSAQTRPTVEVNKPFTLAWDWSQGAGWPAVGFRVELNGTALAPDIPISTTTASMSAILTCGRQSVRVGSVGTTTPPAIGWTPPLEFDVIGCPPNAPTNLRIVITVTQMADGSYRMKIEAVEVLK
jgi:hypothetical protein